MNLCVFTASHCHQLQSHGWAEIVVEFISPQQDILSPEILFGDTEASSSVVTEATSSVVTEASSSVVTEASSSVVTEASSSVVTEASASITDTAILIHCKFEEIKMKSVKRSKSCHYVDDLSAVL